MATEKQIAANRANAQKCHGPTSIAGLMGGARSEVQADTRRVLLEVATWNGPNIHRSSWSLGLRSEASSRCEKGLQPEQCMHAQAVASRLIVEVTGARLLAGTIDVAAGQAPALVIGLRESRVRSILEQASGHSNAAGSARRSVCLSGWRPPTSTRPLVYGWRR